MDASQYKDYILTLLFVKYVTDKFKGVKYADITVPEGGSFDDLVALKGNKNIGEEMDKVIAKLAEAGENNLRGVIDNAHFNDEAKLGSGKEMVDKLTGLIAIFQRDEFNFKKNKASGDDILGDAYEYLMRHFATESGKSKGQFYTPAEVSRILAKVIGIDSIEERDEGYSVYDPACGSGSLLIRAADEAPFEIAIWGQEKEVTTAGLAKMNLVLHNKAAGEIKAGNTFSSPHYFEDGSDDEVLKRFDFAVANPPFSLKNWTDGLKDYGRFDGYGDRPPEKNGDFAWLLHILKSLKSTGKAAVILPHGVLFRGNAEATIRKAIIDKGYIKGIIGLPANLFYGTGIPACIIIIDKADAAERKGIFMIDASHDFIKDGNKNRLRERDIYKIVTTFNQQITDDPKYARFVPNDEIKKKNEYNLNIPRYIDSSTPEDLQDIDAHLHGGIPATDVDSMEKYWVLFPGLKSKLFSQMREGYYQLNIPKEDIRNVAELFSADLEGTTNSSDFNVASVGTRAKAGVYDVKYDVVEYTDPDTGEIKTKLGDVYINGVKASTDSAFPGRYTVGDLDNDAAGLAIQFTEADLKAGSHSGQVRVKQGKVGEMIDFLTAELQPVVDQHTENAGTIPRLIYEYSDPKYGIIAGIDKKIERETTRLALWEQRQRAQFNRLDTLLTKMNQTMESNAAALGQLSSSSSSS